MLATSSPLPQFPCEQNTPPRARALEHGAAPPPARAEAEPGPAADGPPRGTTAAAPRARPSAFAAEELLGAVVDQIKADKELLNSTPDEKRELVAQQLSNTGALIELLRHAAAAK